MLRVKMTLVTLLVAALAVPSLWAQRKSIKEIQSELQKRAEELHVPAVCNAVISGNTPPKGYFTETNKCSSGLAETGPGFTRVTVARTCADQGGTEVTWGPTPRTVQFPAGVSGAEFAFWGNL